MHTNSRKLTLKRLCLKYVLKVIKEITSSTALGLDHIPNKVLKDRKEVLGPHIRRPVELSIIKRELPNQ